MTIEYKEPLIHSHITDGLPDEHTLAFSSVYCENCEVMVHAFNNECMQTWIEIETEKGIKGYCTKCFVLSPVLEIEEAIKNESR